MTAATNPAPASDPITLEVVRNKLDGIANEMQSTLVRSSFSPIVKEGARRFGEPLHPRGRDPRPGDGDPHPPRDPHPGGADDAREVPRRVHARGRHLHLERPLPGRDPPSGHRARHADILGGPADCAQRRDDPPPGRGRHVPGVGSPERDRDLPGGDPHPAPQVPGRGRGQPDPRRHALPQRAGSGDVHGRPQRPGRGVLDRARRVAELAERYGANRLPALTGELLARSEQLVRRAIERSAGRAVLVRGLARQRRRRPRRAGPHRGRGRESRATG